MGQCIASRRDSLSTDDTIEISNNTNKNIIRASNINLLTFGYIRETYDNESNECIPTDIKLLCCEYRGYSLCCIAVAKCNPEMKTELDECYDKENDKSTSQGQKEGNINIVQALFDSIFANHVKCYQWICQCRVWNRPRYKNKTKIYLPIHCAATRNNIEILNVLLADKEAVNARDNKGNTPLHIASNRGLVDAIKILLAHGVC